MSKIKEFWKKNKGKIVLCAEVVAAGYLVYRGFKLANRLELIAKGLSNTEVFVTVKSTDNLKGLIETSTEVFDPNGIMEASRIEK